MPTTTTPFRIGINTQSEDRLFTDSNVQSGVVIPKTSQDNAICPPMPNTTPSPWNAYITGATTANDYRLLQRWQTNNTPALPTHNTTTNRWEYGKHGDVNAAIQGIRTTYKVDILSFESRFEIHDSPWDGVQAYLSGGCFLLSDSVYSYQQIESVIDPQHSEFARYFCGFFSEALPVCAFWIYHATTDYYLDILNSAPGGDFGPAAPSDPICVDPAYYLYRGMGFKFGNQIFLSPVFVSNGRFEITHNRITNEWQGKLYNASNQVVYSVSYALSVDPIMAWGARHQRSGMLVGRQFNGSGLEWTIEGKYTPWITQWNIQSQLATPWQFIDEIAGLNTGRLYRLNIDDDGSTSGYFYQIRSNNTWSAPIAMTLQSGQWKTNLHTNIDAIRYYAQVQSRPVEMVTGSLEETTEDPPPSGTDLVVSADVRMSLVSRCRNIARFTITRVSGTGVCRLVLNTPSGQEPTWQFTHAQLPITIELPITETGEWRVRVYDGNGANLRFDRIYHVRAGDARPREIEYKRRAIGFTACHPIFGIPDATSQIEDGMFAIESGVDDASWK